MNQKMNTTHYPAAHSMDTEWFAIDANGEVAVMDTGTDGVVPMNGFMTGEENSIQDVFQFSRQNYWLDCLYQANLNRKILLYIDDLMQSKLIKGGYVFILFKSIEDLKLFLQMEGSYKEKDLEEIFENIYGNGPYETKHGLIYKYEMSLAKNDLDKYLEQGLIKGYWYGNDDNAYDKFPEPQRFGLYAYEESYDPQKYEIIGKPENAIKFEEIKNYVNIPWVKFKNKRFKNGDDILPAVEFRVYRWEGGARSD